MDILPISVCYAAMLVKVVQCLSDHEDITKNQVVVNDEPTVIPGRKWTSSNISIVNMNQNRSKNKFKNKDLTSKIKLVKINSTTTPITQEIPQAKINDSKADSWRKKTQPLLHRINATLTRSKDAVWATISLTFICIVLLLAVAHSRMWKDYHGSETHHGIPRPDFNERVPFKEVLEHKMTLLKQFVKRKKNMKKSPLVELESLLHSDDDDN